jgi:peptide methionine sulfoxide reductase MsrA
MEKEINLDSIISNIDLEFDSEINKEYYNARIKEAFKETINNILDLAAENAELDDNGETYESCIYWVDKQSILQIKDWIK